MLPQKLAKQVEQKLVDALVDLKGWTITSDQYKELMDVVDNIRIQLVSAVEKKNANV